MVFTIVNRCGRGGTKLTYVRAAFNRIITGFLLFFCIAPTIHATDLLQIYQLALENDPRLKAQQAANQSAHEALSLNTADFLPSVNISTGLNQRYSVNNEFLKDDAGNFTDTEIAVNSTTDSNDFSASLSVPLYRHETLLQRKRTKYSVSQSNADLVQVESALILRVAQAYFDVLTFTDKLALSKRENEAILRQLEHAQTRHKLGLIAINDVHEAKARYDLSIALSIEAQNDLDSSLEAVREITASEHDELVPLRKETKLVRPNPDNINHWIKIGMEKNPNLISARLIAEQAAVSISLNRADYLPELNLRANYGSFQDNFDFSGSNRYWNASVNVNLSMNIFAGGATRSRVRQSYYDHEFAIQNQERTKREIQRQIRDSYKSVIAGISREQALKQAIISNTSALKATQAGYDIGSRTTVDLLNSRRELFSAQIDWAEARYRFIIDTLRLRQSAGIIQVHDVQEFNNWLEPVTRKKAK